jgi:hypothetical protein
MRHLAKHLGLLLAASLLDGCVTAVKTPQPDAVTAACGAEPADTFTKLTVDSSLGASTFGKVVTGALSVKTTPDVITFVNKASKDATARSYLRCVAINRDKYTPLQAAYFDGVTAFLTTGPTAAEFIAWQKVNPPSAVGFAAQPAAQDHAADPATHATSERTANPEADAKATASVAGLPSKPEARTGSAQYVDVGCNQSRQADYTFPFTLAAGESIVSATAAITSASNLRSQNVTVMQIQGNAVTVHVSIDGLAKDWLGNCPGGGNAYFNVTAQVIKK